MPDVRSRLCLLLLGAALMTAGCGEPDPTADARREPPTGEWRTAGCEVSRSAQTMTMGGTAVPVTPPALDAAMRRIDDGGRAHHAGSYAGIEVDQRLVRAIVYRVPSAEFDAFIRISAEDTCVVVRDAAHSIADLTGWHDRITADLDSWTAGGVRISSIGARHDGAGVEIGTQDIERARRELPARYGSGAPLILVEQGPVVPLPSPMSGPAVAPQPGG
jgi:hypothetical protein